MIWLLAVTLVAVGGLSALTPWMSSPSVPLGVSVPRTHARDDVILAARKRYVGGVIVATVVALALLVLPVDDGVLGVLAPLVQLALVGVAFVIARRPIVAAKHAEGWYDGVPVRLRASVSLGQEHRGGGQSAAGQSDSRDTGDDEARYADSGSGFSAWPFVLSAAISLGVLGYGAAIYPQMPQRVVMHGGFDGTPDQWTDKTPLSALGLALVPLGLTLLLGVISWFATRALEVTAARPDGDAVQADRRARLQREGTAQVMGAVCVLLAVLLGALTIMGWHEVTGAPFVVVMSLLLVGPFVVIVPFVWRAIKASRDDDAARRASPSSSAQVAPGRFADSPDDDRFWKGGVIYVNRDDLRTFVPKRVGLGVTVNAASPGGMAFYAVTVLVLVAGIALPILLS